LRGKGRCSRRFAACSCDDACVCDIAATHLHCRCVAARRCVTPRSCKRRLATMHLRPAAAAASLQQKSLLTFIRWPVADFRLHFLQCPKITDALPSGRLPRGGGVSTRSQG
jgi:hypothetical protein